MRILLAGASGQVGRELALSAGNCGHRIIGLGREALDITDRDSIARAIGRNGPDVIVNSAAYTAVDRAEVESARAFAINADGPELLAAQCLDAGIPLVHLSTDYVFNGQLTGAWRETDRMDPLNVYGRSKLEGERRVRRILPSHIILRTSWVFGLHGSNFVRTILRLAAERDSLKIVSDQQGAPTSAASIAHCVLRICDRIGDDGTVPWGVYHFSGSPCTSWHGFACRIVELGLECGLLTSEVPLLPVSTEEFPTAAARPMNSALACDALADNFGIMQSDWYSDLRAMIRAMSVEARAAGHAG